MGSAAKILMRPPPGPPTWPVTRYCAAQPDDPQIIIERAIM